MWEWLEAVYMRLQFVILILVYVGKISMSVLEQKDFSEFRNKLEKQYT